MNIKKTARSKEFKRLQRKVTTFMYRKPYTYQNVIPIGSDEWEMMKYIEKSRELANELDLIAAQIENVLCK